MSNEKDANKEFMEQLRMHELYGQRKDDGSDPFTYTDPADGTVYDWDPEKKAWFPKVTDDFIAAYQANYGFTKEGDPDTNAGAVSSSDPPAPEPNSKAPEPNSKAPEKAKSETPASKPAPDQTEAAAKQAKQKGEKRKADPGWFEIDEGKNTNVYVSGLPPDITPEEFVGLMSKYGIVMRDPITEEYKVKLYKDKDGNLKGDGLCCYLKKESLELAVRLLDDYEVRGYKLHVEAAQFELKGQYDASKKKKKSKDYKKKLQQQQKQLDWRPEKKGDVRKRHEKVVIIRNMFHPSDFEEDPLVLNEYREDLRTECEKFGGVKKVILFDRHPDGVASVAFKEPEEADACILSFNGRWFGGRQLIAHLWDGTTDYQVEETTREREERLKGWSTFLEGGDKAQQTTPTTKETAESSAGSEPKQPSNTTGSDLQPQTEPQSSKQQQQQQQQEEEQGADSTDSSLAGSDNEEA